MADRYLNPNKFAEMLQKSDPSKRNAIIEYLTKQEMEKQMLGRAGISGMAQGGE